MSWLSGAASLVTGQGGAYLIVAGVAFALGAYAGDLRGDAGHAADWEKATKQASAADMAQAKVLVSVVQNAGRREMNYLWNAQAERNQCVENIETFQKWDAMSVEARAAANARASRLRAELNAQSAKYEELKQTYETADKTTVEWLNGLLPDGVRCVRYDDAGCKADPFAAAGYPKPPDRAGAVEK